ncbi:MAG: AbrB/MazE/SpoVT family DNA-binding domain-containing protein [Thermoleophilaceae bacterium]
MPSRSTLRSRGQLTVPADVRAALHVGEGDDVEFDVTKDGTVVLRGLKAIPADQAWFWTPEWQAGERAASKEIAAGRGAVFDDAESFIESLAD